jgi:hypothetical protein
MMMMMMMMMTTEARPVTWCGIQTLSFTSYAMVVSLVVVLSSLSLKLYQRPLIDDAGRIHSPAPNWYVPCDDDDDDDDDGARPVTWCGMQISSFTTQAMVVSLVVVLSSLSLKLYQRPVIDDAGRIHSPAPNWCVCNASVTEAGGCTCLA